MNAWLVPDASHSNVGDYLAQVVVEEVCKLKKIDFQGSVKGTKHLYSIGSILLGFQDATIWGSGFGYDRPPEMVLIRP